MEVLRRRREKPCFFVECHSNGDRGTGWERVDFVFSLEFYFIFANSGEGITLTPKLSISQRTFSITFKVLPNQIQVNFLLFIFIFSLTIPSVYSGEVELRLSSFMSGPLNCDTDEVPQGRVAHA